MFAELEGVPWDRRQASFVCEMALVLPDGRLYHARGECPGLIALTPRGDKGFGYDPVLWVPAYGQTMAELEVGVKNAISHRGRALAALKVLLASLKEELANFCQDNRGVAQPG